jgi:hypothetical protein
VIDLVEEGKRHGFKAAAMDECRQGGSVGGG